MTFLIIRSWEDRHTSNHYNKIHKDAEYVGVRILMIGFIVTMSQNKVEYKHSVQMRSPTMDAQLCHSQLSCAFSSSDTQFWNISQKI